MTIERAIEILNPEHREHYDSIETVNEACVIGVNALRKEATMEAGNWVQGKTRRSATFTCSICGGVAYYPQAANSRMIGTKILYGYCPRCGSRMNTIEEVKV